MFPDAAGVFDNIPDNFRPDRDQEVQPGERYREAHVPAALPGMQGMGKSPDGIGAWRQQGAPPMTANGGGGMPPPGSMAQYHAPYEPEDVSPEGAVRSAGITTLAVAVAFGAGLAMGGWKGGTAGILLTGAAFNAYRAQKWWPSPDPSEKHEAVTSAVLGVAGLLAGGYAGYKAYQGVQQQED